MKKYRFISRDLFVIMCSFAPFISNAQQTLSTNFIGIPKEPYGFSNNPGSAFGLPDFEAATFDFKNDGYEMEIILK